MLATPLRICVVPIARYTGKVVHNRAAVSDDAIEKGGFTDVLAVPPEQRAIGGCAILEYSSYVSSDNCGMIDASEHSH